MCAPATLSATFGGEGATQSLLGSIAVTNRGRVTCRLTGRPAIAMRGGPPREVLIDRPMDTAVMFPGTRFSVTVMLGPGRSATARFQWVNWCNPGAPATTPSNQAEGRRPSQVLVAVAPGAAQISATRVGGLPSLLGVPVCNARHDPSVIYVSLWSTDS